MAKVEAAWADGSWQALDDVLALEVPPDLIEETVALAVQNIRAHHWRQPKGRRP